MTRKDITPQLLALGVLGGGASAFDPLSLSPALWLDASDASTLFQDSAGTTPATADSDVVGMWADKSGNGRHVTQTTTANKPLLKLAQQNGLNVVLFDGSNDTLTRSIIGSDIFSANQNYIVAVMKQDGTQVNNTVIGWRTDNTSNRIVIHATYADVIYWDSVNQTTSRVSASQPSGWDDAVVILECLRDGSQSAISVNGTQLVSGAAPNSLVVSGTEILNVGSYITGTVPLKGWLLELFVLKNGIGSDSRSTLRAYLNLKWGVY